MAGMFYSLKETAERLGKTEDEVRQLAVDGKLREFRDGSNLLFKIEEVNALLAEDIDVGMDLELEPAAAEPEAPRVDDAKPENAQPMDQELAFLKIRYKQPDSDTSQLIETPVTEAMAVASRRGNHPR